MSTPRTTGRQLQGIRARHRRANPLCVNCQRRGIIRAWTQLDHIVPLECDGPDTDDNRQGLCDECHQAKTRVDFGFAPPIGADGWPIVETPRHAPSRPLSKEATQRRMPTDLLPSRIPLTVVCGPAGSGKSTYVRDHAGPNDVVIDLDVIMQRISGLPMHAVMTRWIAPGLEERNRRLRALATDTTHEHAWFIVAAPDPDERSQWARMLGADIVLLDVPADECKRRIAADPSRRGHVPRMHAAVDAWFARNDARMEVGCGMA